VGFAGGRVGEADEGSGPFTGAAEPVLEAAGRFVSGAAAVALGERSSIGAADFGERS
jgi:hypothetical protein